MEPITGTNESKSSVKVNLTAKGEAQVEVKVYEGEETLVVSTVPDHEDGYATLNGDGLATVAVERLVETINSLERQRIKVVGRELPEPPAAQGHVVEG